VPCGSIGVKDVVLSQRVFWRVSNADAPLFPAILPAAVGLLDVDLHLVSELVSMDMNIPYC